MCRRCVVGANGIQPTECLGMISLPYTARCLCPGALVRTSLHPQQVAAAHVLKEIGPGAATRTYS